MPTVAVLPTPLIPTTRKINGLDVIEPKDKSRFHFAIEDSTQGWKINKDKDKNNKTNIKNIKYKSEIGERALEINFENISKEDTCEILVDTLRSQAKDKFDMQVEIGTVKKLKKKKKN